MNSHFKSFDEELDIGDEDEIKEANKRKEAEFKKKVSSRLKKIRIDRGKKYSDNKDDPSYQKYYCCETQEKFSKALRVNRRTVIKWENGEAYPTIDKFVKICNILDCDIHYFLGFDEIPDTETVYFASHYSGINKEIISLAQHNPDYLDCLNFFMLPKNCSALFNETTVIAWKKLLINEELSKIKSPLDVIICNAFDAFYLATPTEKLKPDIFKNFLKQYLPESKLNYTDSGNKENIIYIKECFCLPLYIDFKKKFSNDSPYNYFIDFICSLLFTSLMNSVYVDLYKKKIADKFIDLLNEYLKDI